MDDKAIEAAARAATDWKNQHGTNTIYYWEVDGMVNAAIAAYRDAGIERLTSLCATLQQQAEIHAMEARGANASLAECYRAVTGGTGEPGNWHGARPVVNEIAALRAKLEASNKELREIAESINDPRVNLTMTAAEWCIEAQSKLEAAERDAERYREWKRAFREGEVGLWNAICEANSDAEHDAAIDAARGGSVADDYFKPRHATPAERAVLDKALGRSMSEVPDPEIAALRAQLEQAQAERDNLVFRNDSLREQTTQLLIQRDNLVIAQDWLKATIARQREWIEKAGHRSGCKAEHCTHCGYHKDNNMPAWQCSKHKDFVPFGPCNCGYAELVGG